MTSSYSNTPCAHLAKYSIKTSSIPDDLKISPNIVELSQKKFIINTFDLELDLLDKYEATKKSEVKAEKPAILVDLFDPPSSKHTSSDSNQSSAKRQVSNERAVTIIQDYDAMVEEMLIRIDRKLDVDTCRFLLESSEWNIDTAIDLFQSTYA